MPKRPVSVAFCGNDQVIISADKFGDVYALPLIPPEKPTPSVLSRSATPATAQGFKSQANEKTVHSKRNKKALENQKKQAETEGGITPKKELHGDFVHKLLLGHVSMLTDIAVGKLTAKDIMSGKTVTREWIITADRDEHIRVSRGMPQAHIIEHFLLGHKEFVSRIHIPQVYPNIVISGGGDSRLFVWDYQLGKLLFKYDLRPELVKDLDDDTGGGPPVAVSGIVSYYDKDIDVTRVFVICEKYVSTPSIALLYLMLTPALHSIPRLFSFHIDHDRDMSDGKEIPMLVKPEVGIKLAGNPLGITTFTTDSSQGIIVSYDPGAAGTDFYHESKPHFIQVFEPKGMTQGPIGQDIAVPENLVHEIPFTVRGELERALYTIEPLRKNPYDRDRSQKDDAPYWASNTHAG
jgi:hypothetical protein